MILTKFRGARSRLYRRRFLQVNSTKYSLESSRRDLQNALLCSYLESIIEKWGKKDLAKTTPKKEKTRKREANKRSTANHLELQRKGLQEKIARENKE